MGGPFWCSVHGFPCRPEAIFVLEQGTVLSHAPGLDWRGGGGGGGGAYAPPHLVTGSAGSDDPMHVGVARSTPSVIILRTCAPCTLHMRLFL